jgi:hypothetical protein
MTQAMADGAKKYLDINQFSRQTGLSVSTVRRLKNEGKIPFFQPSGKCGKLLFPADALERAAQAAVPLSTKTASAEQSARLAGRLPKWMQPPLPNNP